MLVIRRAQMHAFEDALWGRYVSKLLERARVEVPEAYAGKTEGELRILLEKSVRNAAYYGIISEADVARYGLWVLRLGRDPAADEGAIGTALRDPDLMGAAKLDALERAARV